jgi:hypothetical protein
MIEHLPLNDVSMKTIFQCLFFLLLCIVSNPLFAQKDAPVVGDAATLVDLLKKDYNTLDPESKNNVLNSDQLLVISILKGYLDQKASVVSSANYTSNLNKIKTEKDKIDQLNKTKLWLEKTEPVFTPITIRGKTPHVDTMSIKDQITVFNTKVNELIYKINEAQNKITQYQQEANIELLTQLKSSFPSNGYLTHIIEQFINKYKAIKNNNIDNLAAASYNASIPKSLPFIGGDLSFETVIDGLSRFLAKRIKEELTNSVLKDIKKQLMFPDPKSPINELKVLLPRTTEYLMQFTVDQITNFSNEIKQYIEDDLKKLLKNAANLKTTPRLRALISENPDLDFAFEALEFIPDLSTLKQPIDYFNLMDHSRNLSRWRNDPNAVKKNLSNAFQMASLLAHSMIVIEEGQPRIASTQFLAQYAPEKHFYFLYIGLLYQQNIKYYPVEFKRSTPAGTASTQLNTLLEDIMKDIPPSLPDEVTKGIQFIETVLIQASESAEKVYTAALDIKKANKLGLAIGPDTILSFINTMIDMSENMVKAGDTLFNFKYNAYPLSLKIPRLGKTKIKLSINFHQSTQKYFKIARATTDLMQDLQHKKFANALLKALEMFDAMVPENTPSRYITVTEKLSHLQEDPVLEYWKVFLNETYCCKFQNIFIGKKKKQQAAQMMYQELQQLTQYYQIRYPGQSIYLGMTQLSKLLYEYSTTRSSSLPKDEIENIEQFLKSNVFKELLISWYLSEDIANLKAQIKAEMGGMEIGLSRTPLFSAQDLSEFDDVFEDYVSALGDVKLWDKNDASFDKAQKRLRLVSTKYLTEKPQKFRLSDYPMVTKIIHFINDIALAKNAEEVEQAIEAIALPSGSYSIKRGAQFNVSLNSYPGILLGGEWAYSESNTTFSTGFTAPVGLSFTKGSRKNHSNGIFLSIIDIGALTRLHLDNDSDTQTIPKFNFANIFSPGIYYHHGWKNTPISLHLGAQFSPQLRTLDAYADPVESLYFGASVVLDIPILNFYTKPKSIRP